MNLGDFKIEANNSILDAIMKIEYSKKRAVLVVENKKVKGIVTEGDIMRLILKKVNLYSNVGDYAKENFIYLLNRDMLKATKCVKEKSTLFIPVLNKSFELIDVITLSDVIEYLERSKL